jgi:hypothetical protein
MRTDKLNKDLVEGDYVIVVGKNYRNLVFAKVLKFSPKQIRVIYISHGNSSQEYLTGEVVKVDPSDVDKIDSELRAKLDDAYERKIVKTTLKIT